MRIVHSIIFYLIAVVSFFIGTIITIPFAIFARHKSRPFQFSARVWSRFLMFCSGSRLTVKGASHFPKDGGLIIASNHQGAFDIVILLSSMPAYFLFVAKSELFRLPFLGWYMSLAGYVPIDRGVSTSAHRTISGFSEVLERGENILIFPEGTRSRDGSLGTFKRGSLMAAFNSGATVIPVAISGSYEMMPRRSFLLNRVNVKVNIGKPISFKEYKDRRASKDEYESELSKLRDSIQALLKE